MEDGMNFDSNKARGYQKNTALRWWLAVCASRLLFFALVVALFPFVGVIGLSSSRQPPASLYSLLPLIRERSLRKDANHFTLHFCMQFNLNFDLVTVKQNYDHKQIIRDRVRVRQNLSQRHVTLLAKIEPLRNPQLLWALARRDINPHPSQTAL